MKRETDVMLVSMPFGPLFVPSIALSLLKASLDRDDIPSEIFYFTFRYAKLIGADLYLKIYDDTHDHDLVGEWIFSDSLFHHQSDLDTNRYLDEVLRRQTGRRDHTCHFLPPPPEDLITAIVEARSKVDMFLEDCLETISDCRPRIIGFTSTFQQHLASLSLARRIKARFPEIFIVFGGANCVGPMGRESIRQFDFVDAVVSGEGDIVFPELVSRVLARQSVAGLPGVICRGRPALAPLNESPTKAVSVRNLDSLPFPDYDSYFSQLSQSSLKLSRNILLLVETSRGCWWGEKHHCTFCGLNPETLNYRSKSAQRALDEIVHLSNRYSGYPFYVVDDILNLSYFNSLLPALAEIRPRASLFFEVKSNLKKHQVQQLRDAGVTSIQPGIESFSSEVLRIMRKGVTGIHNIQLLKWCEELGVAPNWNFLWGFPGEPTSEYERMARLIPLITHLHPPGHAVTIRIDRFSPYFNQPDEFGLKNLRPYPAYQFVYPLPPETVANLAYFFTFEYATPQSPGSYVTHLAEEIAKWQHSYSHSTLFCAERGDLLFIWDRRPVAGKSLTVLSGHKKFIYLACDQIKTLRQILELSKSRDGQTLDSGDLYLTLDELIEAGLMVKENDSYLSLAVLKSVF